MKTDYYNKSLYAPWHKRIKMIADHKYQLDVDIYAGKYNFEAAFNDGLSPREFVERLVKTELDL